MENKMFCFQCEQTMRGTGCTGCAGVCGKSAAAADLQDELTSALIGLARVCQTNAPTAQTHRLVLEALFTTITNVNFDGVRKKQPWADRPATMTSVRFGKPTKISAP